MPSSRTPGSIRVSVTTGPEWKRVEAALKALDSRLAEEFRRELHDAAEQSADKTRRAALQIPVNTTQHTGLRRRVAKGVGVKMTANGVQITTSMNQADERNLPAYLDAQDGWRHPVFANRHVWVRQTTGGSWFREVIEDSQPQVEEALTDVWEDAARTIAAAGAG